MNIKEKSDPSGPQFPCCHIYKNNTLLLHKTTIKIKYDETKKTINLHNKFPIMKQ